MNELKIFENSEFGRMGVMEIDGKCYFPATECAKMLGYSRPADAVRDHCKGVVKMPTPSNGGTQEKGFIPEGDLYRLIVRSKLPSAEKFERWVFDEVLPAIRKHGGYLTAEKVEEALLNPDVLIRLATELKDEREARRALESKVAEDAPKVLFAQAVEQAENSILVGDLAKLIKQNGTDIGQKRLFARLREEGYLGKTGESYNMPTQRAMEMQLFRISERTINNPDGSVRLTRTVKVTGKGQVYFINRYAGGGRV
nr:MAG TPA: repressor domain protein [Caudoviricetes sp.]